MHSLDRMIYLVCMKMQGWWTSRTGWPLRWTSFPLRLLSDQKVPVKQEPPGQSAYSQMQQFWSSSTSKEAGGCEHYQGRGDFEVIQHIYLEIIDINQGNAFHTWLCVSSLNTMPTFWVHWKCIFTDIYSSALNPTTNKELCSIFCQLYLPLAYYPIYVLASIYSLVEANLNVTQWNRSPNLLQGS